MLITALSFGEATSSDWAPSRGVARTISGEEWHEGADADAARQCPVAAAALAGLIWPPVVSAPCPRSAGGLASFDIATPAAAEDRLPRGRPHLVPQPAGERLDVAGRVLSALLRIGAVRGALVLSRACCRSVLDREAACPGERR